MTTQREGRHQPGDLIAERYQIIDTLGQGGVGITYEAEDLQTQQRVALKALSLRRMTDWKTLELFEREARTLEQLDHPAIPHYLDSFEADIEGERTFYIVQQLAPGQSLAVLAAEGWRPTEAEAIDIATQILEILSYLHALTPLAVHRDIKPQNIICQPDGQIVLVDFGAVQDAYHHTLAAGSTVVGTFGYMAPEQFRGQSCPATDLYGLGATLIALMTGKEPADLPQQNLKLQFRRHLRSSRRLSKWLEQMLEPAVEDRFQSADEALAALQRHRSFRSTYIPGSYQPRDSNIVLTKTQHRCVVEIPPVGLRSTVSKQLISAIMLWLGTSLFALWLTLEALSNSAIGTLNSKPLLFFMLAFSTIFGLRALHYWSRWSMAHTTLELTPRRFKLLQSVRPWDQNIPLEGDTRHIVEIQLEPINIPPCLSLSLPSPYPNPLKKHCFGFLLTRKEQRWLSHELQTFLASLQEAELKTMREA